MTTEPTPAAFEAYQPRTWPGTYRLPPARLTVPYAALTATLGIFASYATVRLEAVCFWYGPRTDDGSGNVAAVVVPTQLNHAGRYQVPSMEMAAVAAATKPTGWRNLSQIHTHPGAAVEHSFYDDDHANSRRALSLVLPFYGHGHRWPETTVALHEYQDGEWHLLSRSDAARRIVVDTDRTCEVIDLR